MTVNGEQRPLARVWIEIHLLQRVRACSKRCQCWRWGTLVRGNHPVTAQDLGKRGGRGTPRMTVVTQAPLDIAITPAVHLTQR